MEAGLKREAAGRPGLQTSIEVERLAEREGNEPLNLLERWGRPGRPPKKKKARQN